RGASDQDVDNLVQANLNTLGIGPAFGLNVQSVTRDRRFGQTIVRVQLTDGRGNAAVPFDNHGILTFRSDRRLADYYSPLSALDGSRVQTPMQTQSKALALMNAAKTLRLDQHDAPLSLVRRAGHLTIEARVLRTEGFLCWVEAFTPEHPEGERREVITP